MVSPVQGLWLLMVMRCSYISLTHSATFCAVICTPSQMRTISHREINWLVRCPTVCPGLPVAGQGGGPFPQVAQVPTSVLPLTSC